MNTHESYVSFTTAKMLKEAGFKWGCDYMYGLAVRHNGKEIDEDEEYELKSHGKADEIEYVDGGEVYRLYYDNTEPYNGYARPTLDVAQRWLREVKECAVIVMTHNVQAACVSAYVYCIYPISAVHPCEHINGFAEDPCFDIYEEALEAGIQRALIMLLGKQK